MFMLLRKMARFTHDDSGEIEVKVIEHTTIIHSRGDHVKLIPLGDIHLGAKGCDEELLQKVVDRIKNDPDTYWLGMGDYCDNINISDPRWDGNVADWIKTGDLSNLAKVQADKLLEYIYPIRHKCIGLLEGNHEDKLRRRYSNSMADYVAVEMGVPNLTYTAHIRWRLERQTDGVSKNPCREVIIYATHGAGGGRYLGGKINRLIGTEIGFEANIYLMGHVHEKLSYIIPNLRVYGSGADIRHIHDDKYFILTGTFLKTYENNARSYGERTMYNPTALGVMTIDIKPFNSTHVDGKDVEMPPLISVSQ